MDKNRVSSQVLNLALATFTCAIFMLGGCRAQSDANRESDPSPLLTQFIANNCTTVTTIQTAPSDYPSLSGSIQRTDNYWLRGKQYDIIPRDSLYEETGVGSFYGPRFNGDKNATMTTFYMHKISAAHTTLPLPSVVEVTAVAKDNSICRRLIVPVTDRGPYRDDRILDLSEGAARKLGVIEDGIFDIHVCLRQEKTKIAFDKVRIDPSLSQSPLAP